ncbi:MAG: RNA-binding protein [Candidatus Brocadiia bacterium]
MNIYVGNLSFKASEEDLRKEFSAFGEVKSVVIIRDRETGRSRGFGFVEMSTRDQGDAAIKELNGKQLLGRALRINEALNKPGGPRKGPRGEQHEM